MTQSPTQTTPTPGQNNQPEVKVGPQLTDAEKKAQADKASVQTKA